MAISRIALSLNLPAGTVDTLLKPENKAMLTGILTCHVVAGRVTATDIAAQVETNGGKAVVTTVQGAKLTVREKDGTWYLSDAKEGCAAPAVGADVLSAIGRARPLRSGPTFLR